MPQKKTITTLLITLLFMANCTSAPNDKTKIKWPKISTSLKKQLKNTPQPPQSYNALIIDSWTLPIAYNPEKAWELLETDIIDHNTLQDYRQNNIRLGILDKKLAPAFIKYFKGLPVQTNQYPLTKDLRSTYKSPSNLTTTQLNLRLAPDPIQSHTLSKGHFQFIAKLKTINHNSKILQLIPHHAHLTSQQFLPTTQAQNLYKTNLSNKDSLDRQLKLIRESKIQGTTFDKLSLDLQLLSGKALIISFIPPEVVIPKNPPPSNDEKKTKNDTPKKQPSPDTIDLDDKPKTKEEIFKALIAKNIIPANSKLENLKITPRKKKKKENPSDKKSDEVKKEKIELTPDQKKQVAIQKYQRKAQLIAKKSDRSLGSKLLAKKRLGVYTQTMLVIWIKPKAD